MSDTLIRGTEDLSPESLHSAGHHRSWPRMRRAQGLLTVACLAVSGCAATQQQVPVAHPSSATAPAGTRQFNALLTEEAVEQDLTQSQTNASQSLPAAQTLLRNLRTELVADDAAIRKVTLPASAHTDYQAFLTDNSSLISGIDRAVATATDITGLLDQFYGLNGGKFIDLTPSAERLKHDLGLPKSTSWFDPPKQTNTVYSDNFTDPSSFNTGNGAGGAVSEGGGHLDMSTNGALSTGVKRTRHFDGSHIRVQVEAAAQAGSKVAYGIYCSNIKGNSTVGVAIATDGTWEVRSLKLGGGFVAGDVYESVTKPDTTIKTGQATNRIQVDCDQYGPGVITVRLVVNDKKIAAIDVPGTLPGDESLPGNIDPGPFMANVGAVSSHASTVQFTNWSVSTLPTPPPPPVPITTS